MVLNKIYFIFKLSDLCTYFEALWLEKEEFFFLQTKLANQNIGHLSIITINS